MNEELTKLQEEYAALCIQEKEVLGNKAILKRKIEDMLPDGPWESKTPYGAFKMVAYPKWTYTDSVNRLEEDLKILKIEEQEQGIAKEEVSYGLRFNAKK